MQYLNEYMCQLSTLILFHFVALYIHQIKGDKQRKTWYEWYNTIMKGNNTLSGLQETKLNSKWAQKESKNLIWFKNANNV